MAALIALMTTAVTPAPPAETVVPYWDRIGGCNHGHRRSVAELGLTRLLRNHVPLTARRRRHATHLRRCVLQQADRRAVAAHWKQLRAWRTSYAHRWPITFNRLEAWEQAWARSTSWCEARMNPQAYSSAGPFFGAFQFMLPTWYAAGGTGVPTQHSWHYQAVIAVRWMHRAGAGQWPVCG